jgi:hypothetical protein
MSQRDFKSLLRFGDRWLRLGLLTEEKLRALGREYETGKDRNTEHYRYRVFRDYLTSHRPLPAELAKALYELGREDPDPAMGGAMMADIVGLPECPVEVMNEASASGEKHLANLVRKKRLLAELDSGLTEELFARCVASGDAVIQRDLLERQKLSRAQLTQLAETGANRAVRNVAAARLRSL